MSLQVACGEVHACSSIDHEACESHTAYRPATREDVLAAVRELGGVEVDARLIDPIWLAGFESLRGRVPERFLIVPLDTGDTE
jgi:hypothetical protein